MMKRWKREREKRKRERVSPMKMVIFFLFFLRKWERKIPLKKCTLKHSTKHSFSQHIVNLHLFFFFSSSLLSPYLLLSLLSLLSLLPLVSCLFLSFIYLCLFNFSYLSHLYPPSPSIRFNQNN